MDLTRLYLLLGGFGDDADAVTRLIGLAPTRVLRRDEPLSRRAQPRVRAHERWELEAPGAPQGSFEAQLTALLAHLAPRAAGVRQAAAQFGGAVIQYQATYRDTFSPGYHLTAEQLNAMAALGVALDLDTYVLYEASEREPGAPAA